MRFLFHLSWFLWLFCFQPIYADRTCKEIKSYVRKYFSQSGILEQDETGYVYVSLDNKYIYELLDFIKKKGFEKPPYFDRLNAHGAHISVIYAKEAERYNVGKINEVGRRIFFKVKDCAIVHPSFWKEMQSVYIITLSAPALNAIRKKYGLAPPEYDYHITIGVIPKQKANRAA